MKMEKAICFIMVGFLLINIPVLSSASADKNGEGKGHHTVENSHSEESRHGVKDTDKHKEGHGGIHEEQGEKESGMIRLSKEQMAMAGIVSSPLSAQSVASEIQAPGEVKFNAYRSAKVNPRISAQIISREAKLGDGVKKDQSLIILSSIEMAQAQGELIVSSKEWARVNELGAKVVSDRRFIEAKIAFNQSKAKVTAYGMTANQISDFLNPKNNPQPDGVFRLLAPITGTIIRDDFTLGELIEPGKILFEISDESSIWVEAQLSPEDGKKIVVGSPARVKSGSTVIPGQVIQIQHLLDETTRTLGVRVEVPNDADFLHPGTFVDVLISGREHVNVLALPREAVLRNPDGDFVIFLEMNPGEFNAKEIKVVRSEGDLVIIDGIDAGQSVVVKGAFFVQSEFAKSAFQAHNH